LVRVGIMPASLHNWEVIGHYTTKSQITVSPRVQFTLNQTGKDMVFRIWDCTISRHFTGSWEMLWNGTTQY
jgi:hypothetical protein